MDKVMKEKNSPIKRFLSRSGSGILIGFILLIVVLSIASRNFLTISNIITVARQASFVAIISFGMTFVISMAGIDLSVGGIAGVAGMIVALLILQGTNIYLSIVVALLAGIGIGLVTGFLVVVIGMPDFIATLGMMNILRGVLMVVTKGMPIYGLHFPEFQFLAQGYIGPLPMPVIIMIVLFIILYYVFNHTRLGRYTVAVGSSQEAARLVGIKVGQIKFIVYGLMGLLSAISGVLITSRVEAAVADAGSGYEMDAISAVVLGGTSLAGGKGNIVGSLIGALLMAVLSNGMNLLNISTFWQQVVVGVVVLIAVSIDNLSSRRVAK